MHRFSRLDRYFFRQGKTGDEFCLSFLLFSSLSLKGNYRRKTTASFNLIMPATKALHPTNAARVRFSDSVSYMGWVCCWFSSLLGGFFSGYSGFPPSAENNISKIKFDLETVERRATPWIPLKSHYYYYLKIYDSSGKTATIILVTDELGVGSCRIQMCTFFLV